MKKLLIQLCSALLFLSIAGPKVLTNSSAKPPAIVSPLVGKWKWVDESQTQSFDMQIKQDGNQLVGNYCDIARNGNKIDCSEDEDHVSFTFPVTNANKFDFTFLSEFASGKGDAEITYDGTYITWHVTKEPLKEYYCPKDAKLKRVKKL
jgi:hypothetical protein